MLTGFYSCAINTFVHTISDTDARNQWAGLIETATRDRDPIIITRNGEGVVVLLAADEYSAMEETLRSLSTPANAGQNCKGLAGYAAGKIQPGELCD